MSDSPTIIDLDDVDADDAATVGRIVDELRAAAKGGRRVIVRNCPQMVAHTLYKAGILARREIELESYREEEPYG